MQLYSAPHFAFKCRVRLLLLLMIKPGASVCPASMAQCSYHKLAIKPTELHQLPAAFGIKRSTGWLGCLVLRHGFRCYWKMLPSTEFSLWFYKCAVPNCMTSCQDCYTKRFLWKAWTVNKTEEDLEHAVNSSCLLHRCTHTPPHTLPAYDDFLIYSFAMNRFQLLSHRSQM